MGVKQRAAVPAEQPSSPQHTLRSPFTGLPASSADAERAAEILRAAAGAARLTSGVDYDISATAELMDVGRQVLLGALDIALSEGVVSEVRERFFRVAVRSPDDLRELIRLRVPLESAAVRRVASRNLNQSELALLRRLSRATADAARDDDFLGYINADLAFHLEIMRLAGPPELVEIIRVLRARSQLTALHDHDGFAFMEDNIRDHDELVTLVELGDVPAAGNLVRTHITRAVSLWTAPEQDSNTQAEH